ncbi:MAG: hypothetical protein IBX62_04270 [Coriobacteriia bacterium]|nr:hypothetical protein [Coriobacteriia bacterium]
MSKEIICRTCGETEELRGQPSPEGIVIHCGSCGASWLRDSEPDKCATCGRTDLVQRAQALTQYSRGTQLSIVGLGSILLCAICDRQMLEWSEGRAVPFTYRSSALDSEAAATRSGSGGSDVRITP